MANNGSDSECCSSSNPVSTADNVNTDAGLFVIEHWNAEVDASNFNVEVFDQDNGSFNDKSICLEFPKFSKGFQKSDFNNFVQKYVGEENLEKLENGKHSNMWIMQLKTAEVREKLLRLWKVKIKKKICCISPYHIYELRGYLHWLPHFVSDDDVKTQLSQFGDVLILENVVQDNWSDKIKSEIRYFGLRLKDGMVKNDLPHFLKFGGYRTLVIVHGRQPACFHCREFGHNKKNCEKYKEKLTEYCKNPEARKPRTKPRGRRHRPEYDARINYQANEHQYEANTSANTTPGQKDSQRINSSLKRLDRKLTVDKESMEILGILRSIKEWKEKNVEMVEQTVANVIENLRNFSDTEMSESEVNSVEFSIQTMVKQSSENMRLNTINMIEQTLNNLKNVISEHFGLDSNETLEKLISNLDKSKKGQRFNEKLSEEQLLSYVV